jgi:hypothetical protein
MRIRGPGAGERADRSKALTTRALEGSFLWSLLRGVSEAFEIYEVREREEAAAAA